MEKTCSACIPLFKVLSIPVFFILYLFTALSVMIALPLAWLKMKAVVRGMIEMWSRTAFLLMGKRLKVQGRKHITKGKPCILVANHSSMFDILAIMAVYPGVVWFGREHLLKVPVFGSFLKMLNYIPMKAGDLANARGTVRVLAEYAGRHTIAMFPEGTRTTDGKMNRLRKGFIHVQRTTHLDILPVTLRGFFRFKPKTQYWIDFGSKLGVVVHPSIASEELAGMDDQEILDRVRTLIGSALP